MKANTVRKHITNAAMTAYLSLSNPRTVRRLVSFAMLALTAGSVLLGSDAIAAGKTLGDIGSSIHTQGQGVAGAVRIVIFIMGFGMVGTGLYLWATAQKKNQPMGWGVMLTIFGSLMLVVNLVINSTSQTIFGQDASGGDATTVLEGG